MLGSRSLDAPPRNQHCRSPCRAMLTPRACTPQNPSARARAQGAPGLSFGKKEEKLGWRCQPTAAVMLDNVAVPEEARLGAEGEGFKIAMKALDGGRVNIAACSVGGAAFCLDYAARYVRERSQFGRPLDGFQTTQHALADMWTAVSASRLMVRAAARSLDAGASSGVADAAAAKRFATDECYAVADRALQLLGGYGYLRDHPIERFVRDLRVHRILEGTNEVMRGVLFRELYGARAPPAGGAA